MIFTPEFDLNSYEFQNGALDPREIGFFINNQDRLILFVETMKKYFCVNNNPVLINQKIRKFISTVESFEANIQSKKIKGKEVPNQTIKIDPIDSFKPSENKNSDNSKGILAASDRIFSDLLNEKLKDEDVLLLKYIIEYAKFKLGTGWQEAYEIENIRAWEDIEDINGVLSRNYPNSLRRLQMRRLAEVSEVTSNGKPKEVRMIDEFQEKLIDLPDIVTNKINQVITKNRNIELPF